MKYSHSAITQLTRWYRQVLIKCAILNAAVFVGSVAVPAVAEASEINQTGVPYRTATTIEHNANVFNISTTTTNKGGDVGLNTFGRFNVSQGDVANLNLINQQSKLVNLVFDSSASQIDGIVNSYKGGKIGGNILFANPNGFVVGKTGVFNVGSLTLMTPKRNDMENVFMSSGEVKESGLNNLISFTFKGENYFLNGGEDTEVKLSPAKITINGTINSGAGIDLFNGGREIEIGKDAKLNANMNFSGSGANVTATPKSGVTANTVDKDKKYKFAMEGGNGIVIVSQNTAQDRDYLSAIVNIDGKVKANGGDVVAQTEIYRIDKEEDVSTSLVNVKSNADISGHDVTLNARASATQLDHNMLGLGGGEEWYDLLNPAEWVNALASDFVHIGDIKTKVTVESGAHIRALNDVMVNATALLPISELSVMETLAFGYTDLDVETEAIVKSGAHITAGNDLTVDAVTNLTVDNTTGSSSLAEIIGDIVHPFGHYGSYALSLSLVDAVNRAVVEHGADLNVTENINVLASMLRNYKSTTKNGMLPIVDRNRGSGGVAIGIDIVSSVNEAIMNADANIAGKLLVNADYSGNVVNLAPGCSYAAGQDGDFGVVGRIVNGIFGGITKLTPVMNKLKLAGAERSSGVFNKIVIVASAAVTVENTINNALIGDVANNIKPVIKAKEVIVGSTLTDHKSQTYASSEADNGETSVAGAVAVNVKNLDSNAKVYADLTLSNPSTEQALIIYSKTDMEHPEGVWDWIKNSLHGLGLMDDIKTDEPVTGVNSSNVDDYLKIYGMSDNFQTDIDNTGAVFDIFNVINFNDIGVNGTFNTFASSQANAMTNSGETSAWAGAVATAVFDTTSNAELVGGSSVKLTGNNAAKNNVLIQAETESEVWTGAALMSLFNVTSLFGGLTARDGDSAGGSVSVQVANIDTTAKIGAGAIIDTPVDAAKGNVSVLATEDGQFINLGNGTGSADNSGLAGTIAVSVLAGGETQAIIEKDAVVNAKDVTVKAEKDDVMVHGVIGYTNAQDTKSFGVSTIGIGDAVEAYIAGNVNAVGNVLVNAYYDKIFVNTVINAGVAKNGTDNPVGEIRNPGDDEDWLDEWLSAPSSELDGLSSTISGVLSGSRYDFTRATNPGKETSAYAGNILVNVADSEVKAHIDGGAKVMAGGNVTVEAASSDTSVEVASILSVNGKSGGGASISFDLNKNDIQAYIGNAEVDAGKDLKVKASEDNLLVAVSAGIGQAKDKSGVGTVSLDIQRNEIEAAIRDGAKINTHIDNADQTVDVEADMTAKMIKAVGALSIQAGGEGEGRAAGAAIDGDIAVNDVKAYIKGAEVNAAKELNVKAKQDTTLIDISAAGAVSTSGGAYDGTVAAYVSVGNTDAYIEDANINQTAGRVNKAAKTTISAENSYDNITVTGAIAGGKGNAAGGSLRADWISDEINSYIKDSAVDTTGSLTVKNNSVLDTIAITVAGALSTGQNAFSGAIMFVVNDTTQNNYIDNSAIKAQSVSLDSDSKFKTVAVTGGATVATKGTAVGGSIYTAVADNDIYTYIKNSDVTSTNDITMTSDYDIDSLSIIFAGSGGQGVAASGAVSTLVNNSNSDTYIKSEAGKKNNIRSTDGKITLKGANDIDIKTINGSISVSLGAAAIGASVNTVVDNNDLSAGIEGVNVIAKGDVDVEATSDEDIMSISIGGAGGSGAAIAGSVNTMVMASDVDAYIKNSDVTSDSGDVKVIASGDSEITGGTGTMSISFSSAALGASIVTGVINNGITAQIENSKVNANKNVKVSATANETIGTSTAPFITIAGGFSQGATIEGVVDTMILNSTADAHIKGTKTIDNAEYGISAGNDVEIIAQGEDTIYGVGGSVSASTSVGIGATVNTIVVDKDTKAKAENTRITAKNIKSSAKETDKFFTTLAAAAGAGTAGIGGVVNTNVVKSEVISGLKNSTLSATNDISSTADAKADMQTITGAIVGGGAAGVGVSAVNDVIKYSASAYADNVTASFNNLNVKATADSVYKFSTVSGAGGGSAGVAGVENVNYINNEIKAYATGNLTGNKADISAKDTVTFKDSYSGVVAGGGAAGVGATIEVNSITSTILAYIGGNVEVDNIDIKAEGEQNFEGIVAAGFSGSGAVAVAGTALANVVETTVKAYVKDNADITGSTDAASNKVNINAKNTLNLTEGAGSVAISGAASFGASVAVNKIANTVEAYTGDNVSINSNNITLKASADNNIGKSGAPIVLAAGSAGLGAGLAGAVMYNSIADNVAAYIGTNNEITVASTGKLEVSAEDNTKIYESNGAAAIGIYAGIGASVAYNVIENTVLAYIGALSNIEGNGDVSLSANSNETLDALGVVASGGKVGLSGGVIYSTIGTKKGNASYNNLSASDKKVFDSAKNQADGILNQGSNKISAADGSYQSAYNSALDRVKENSDGSSSRVADIEQATDSLFAKSDLSGSGITGTDRKGTTSAFVDTAAEIKSNSLKITAKNTGNIDIETDGGALGVAAVGVSAAVSDNYSTTNAFISNNVIIDTGSLQIKAESSDVENSDSLAAVGGIVGGAGSVARINSDKTANAYILQDTYISSEGDINIDTKSTSNTVSYAKSGSFGGVVVGVSDASSKSVGSAKVDIGSGVTIVSKNGAASITTDTNEKATAKAWAAAGGLGGGSGAVTYAKTGKDNTINVGSNLIADVKGKFGLSSSAKNDSYTEANGRAYGGISAGGANGDSIVDQKSGIKIADAASAKAINAGSVDISSKVSNKAKTDIYAGAGALAGFSGSTAKIDIKSDNANYVGKNYNVMTTGGNYSAVADTFNEYKAYDKSDAFGVVTAAIPGIKNTVNSTVSSDSEADVIAAKGIVVKAANEIAKYAVSGYDLYGGAGGLASGAGGSINDNLTMNTTAKLGGNYAHANGEYGNGSINVSAYNIANINEKADLYSHGGIAGADTDSIVKLTAAATTTVANKDITTKDDNINYTARNDVDIYTKSNVESYGGVAGAGGTSEATSSSQSASVVVDAGTKSVSGRDTNISAISNKSLEAYINAETGGLISIVEGEADAHNKNSTAYVTINSGAEVKAFDRMNISASSSSQKIKAKRDALAYELGFIPYHGTGNEYTTNNNSSGITINGAVESGLGANRVLVIDADGTTHSDNDNVKVTKEQIGTITTADIDVDIQSYENSITNITTAYDEYVRVENQQKAGYQTTYNNAQAQKTQYEENNETLRGNIADTQVILDKVSGAINDIAQVGTAEYAENYGSIAEVQAVINAYKNIDPQSLATQNAYNAAVSNLNSKRSTLQSEIQTYNSQIAANDNSIAACESTMSNAQAKIAEIDQQISATTDKYNADVAFIQTEIDNLNAKKAAMTDAEIPVFSMMVDDIVIRSGETNLTGPVSGTGSITAPGNKFTIDIINNSVSNVIYGDLIIGRNLKGGIYGSSIASGITQTIKYANGTPKISILNKVDKNDPTINLDSNAGDIVLRGNVENTYGSVDLTNYTGSILSEGNLTARDLHIKVPNGGFNQQYNGNEMKVGGTSGTGAIVASGDIDIAAKTIDVNGLIQSGTEIKEVTIPDFSVVKEGDKYYQVVNGVKTEMEESSTTAGYYYLNLSNDTSDVAALKQIRAYFKPSDNEAADNVPGDIYLFKANIDGGNVTLTGNIVSTSNTGKIVLLNKYGHINVVNNSDHDLVTSALSADTKGQGKLTINDFKFESSDGGNTFANLTQASLTEDFLSAHAGKYTAYVDDNGQVVTSAANVTSGNGSWGGTSASVRADGANVYSTSYKPGNDAYVMTAAGGTYSYQVYVPRSWIVELFCGKQYSTVTVSYDPTYAVKNNSVGVTFQGFDKPVINVTSNGSGDIVLNNDISSLVGDVNIKSGGSIITNSLNNVISANNINLEAASNIGQELMSDGTVSVVRPIQTEIIDNGTLTAKGNNLYINYPYDEISNVAIEATGNVYLSTDNGNFNGAGKTVNIKADGLELRADAINLDMAQNQNISLDINKLRARAKDDVVITNKGDLTISSIVSENAGTISLESKEGSIIAADDTGTYGDYHINGGNLVLRAVNGAIGSDAAALKIANDGIYNVEAADDIYINSMAAMYIDKIQSDTGGIVLNSVFGIIASAISDENRNYNLASAGEINLSSATGNIENLLINTEGTINAIAGYGFATVEGLSDINIRTVSENDMNIGVIKASQNITLTSNKGIKNASDASFVSGESIALKAVGDVGEHDSAVYMTANREITVLSKGGSNVYLETGDDEKGFKINRIATNNGEGSLGVVEITSAGNITNASAVSDDNEVTNIKAESIKLVAAEGKNIGSRDRYLVVDTTSDDASKGLSFVANEAYIRGAGSLLNITDGTSTGDVAIYSENDISVNNITADNTAHNADILLASFNGGVKVNDAKSSGLSVMATDAEISGSIVSDAVDITNKGVTKIDNASFEYLTDRNTALNILQVWAEDDVEISNTQIDGGTFIWGENGAGTSIDNTTISGDAELRVESNTNIGTMTVGGNFVDTSDSVTVSGGLDVAGDVDITAQNGVTIADMSAASLTIDAASASIVEADVDADATIITSGNTKIGNAEIGGNFDNTSANTTVTGELDVAGGATIEAGKNIVIADAVIGQDLDIAAQNIEIADIELGGNLNASVDTLTVNASSDLNIDTISGNTKDYTDKADIVSAKNITNRAGGSNTNITVKNANLKAGNSIGKDKALNMELVDGNNINIKADNVANLKNTGAAANYGKVAADKVIINSSNDVTIADLDTDELTLKTATTNVNITGNVETKGTITTANKNIVIDNTSLAPYENATVQLYLTKKPMHLVVDRSSNIRTESQNVTRHDMDILINKVGQSSGMEGEVTLSAESALKNSYHGESLIDEANASLYNIPTLSDYISAIADPQNDNYIDGEEILGDTDIMNIINRTKADKSKGQKYSEDEKKEKML